MMRVSSAGDCEGGKGQQIPRSIWHLCCLALAHCESHWSAFLLLKANGKWIIHFLTMLLAGFLTRQKNMTFGLFEIDHAINAFISTVCSNKTRSPHLCICARSMVRVSFLCNANTSIRLHFKSCYLHMRSHKCICAWMPQAFRTFIILSCH